MVQHGGCGHSSRCLSPPIARLPGQSSSASRRTAGAAGFSYLEPVIDAAGAIDRAEAFRDTYLRSLCLSLRRQTETTLKSLPICIS